MLRPQYKQCNAPWAAQYNTWLLIKLTPKGVVFSFLFNAMHSMNRLTTLKVLAVNCQDCTRLQQWTAASLGTNMYYTAGVGCNHVGRHS